MKKMDEKKLKEDSGFPYGWNKGDTCVMITNKTKKSTCEYTVESYDGRYFGVRSHTGLYHRVSPWRMFRTRESYSFIRTYRYHELGGNGMITKMKEEIDELHLKKKG